MIPCSKYEDVAVHHIESITNGFILQWHGTKRGWGEYTIYFDPDTAQLKGESEYMDRGDDKEFLEYLFQYILKHIEIVE